MFLPPRFFYWPFGPVAVEILADTFIFFFAVQDEVAAAQPEIDKRTEQLVSKGRWQVPGYKVRIPHSNHTLPPAITTTDLKPTTGKIRRPLCALVYIDSARIPHAFRGCLFMFNKENISVQNLVLDLQ